MSSKLHKDLSDKNKILTEVENGVKEKQGLVGIKREELDVWAKKSTQLNQVSNTLYCFP